MLSLNQLEQNLNERIINPEFKDLKEIIDWFADIEIESIRDHFVFEENNYCRKPLISKDEYDLLICCWKPGQGAPYHGHPNQGCLVKMLKGSLQEELKLADGNESVKHNTEGAVAYINDSIGVHQVKNISEDNAVSLHLYAPGGYIPVYK